MPTTDDLRTAMNELVAEAEALSSANLLRAGKRHRTRRRLLTGTGAAAAVLAVVAVVSQGPWKPHREQTAPAASAVVSASPSPSAMTRAERFVYGPEQETEQGVFTTVITDRQLPEGEVDEAEVDLRRIPGESKLPQSSIPSDGERIREIVVAGTKVRILEGPADAGWDRQLDWIVGHTLYVLSANAHETAARQFYGPTEDDLRWMIEKTLTR